MTVKELKESLNSLPSEYDNLKVMFHNSSEGCTIEISTTKPKLNKTYNCIILRSPKSKYSEYDR